jgi:hypothetical protein
MNVRGLRDLESNNNGSANRDGMPLLGGNISSENPRKESFFFFLRSMCCPLSSFKSFTFVVSILNIIVYIITLCFGIDTSTKDHVTLLGPLPETLEVGSLVRIRFFKLIKS